MEQITEKSGFSESAMTIVPNLTKGVWPLLELREDKTYKAVLSADARYPLTELQKSWLKALLGDRRLDLFLSGGEMTRLEKSLDAVSPLYDETVFHYFDRYGDGDPYESLSYRQRFLDILTALEESRILSITYMGKNNTLRSFETAPCQLQYSPKDDKFRLCGLECYRGRYRRSIILNLGKIVECRILEKHFSKDSETFCYSGVQKTDKPVVLEISGERNSLERCMLHFSSYEKHTEYDEAKKCFVCSIWYDKADETELLIDVLSFGPVVRVIGPEPFLAQIRERVRRQHERFYE